MDDNKVAVLLEDLRAQFRTFGEKLDTLEEKMDKGILEVKNEISDLKMENRHEHIQLRQMIKEPDQEVQVEIKRVK
jgi:hypothetical protein